MAHKKSEIGVITGLGTDTDSKLTVLKSSPLITLWRSDMTLPEFKILDLYLSRINSHDPDKRTVLFTRGEMENALGVTQIKKQDMLSRLNGLGRMVELELDDNLIHSVSLFEEVIGEINEDGLWTIKLTCTQSAMKYIFNIEDLGYLRYKLRSIKSLSSRYSYILFLYLESNRWRKTWEVSVDELKTILSCDKDQTYSEFKRFNNLILLKSQRELTEKTECRFSYTTVKNGKRVKAIRFALETLRDKIPDQANDDTIQEQLKIIDLADDEEEDYQEDKNAMYAAVLPSEFTPEEVEAVVALAAPLITSSTSGKNPAAIELCHYLRHKTTLMNASRKPVKHKFSYLLKMIRKDIDEQI